MRYEILDNSGALIGKENDLDEALVMADESGGSVVDRLSTSVRGTMTAEKLKNAEAMYQTSAATAETNRVKRNAAVRQAIEAGWTHAQIAEATGLTRSRVGQIALQRKEAAPSGTASV